MGVHHAAILSKVDTITPPAAMSTRRLDFFAVLERSMRPRTHPSEREPVLRMNTEASTRRARAACAGAALRG
jgi:hypothetical protein